jgi:alpha-amylase
MENSVYYGQEQHLSGAYNPVNREALWLTGYSTNATDLPSLVKSLNALRSYAAFNGTQYTAATEPGSDYLTFITYPIYNSSNVVGFRKGFVGNQVITVLSNLGSNTNHTQQTVFQLNTTGTGFTASQNITEIVSCNTYLTDSNGNLNVNLSDGNPRVYYPTDSLGAYSNLCGHQLATTSSGNPGNSSSSAKSSASVLVTTPGMNYMGLALVTVSILIGLSI